MQLQLDKSLYNRTGWNRATREAIDQVNAEARQIGLVEDPEWGMMTTLRMKKDYLEWWKSSR